MKRKKVILMTNMIPPNRIPVFNYVAQKGNFDFKVIALSEKEKNREWQLAKEKIKFDYQVLPGWQLFFITKTREIPIHLNRGVLKTLFQYKPDVIITEGYDSLAYWVAFLYAKIFRKKYILWNGTTLLSVGSIKGWRGLLKKIIIQGANKCIAYGTKAKEYLEYFGAKSDNIYISFNTVDIDFFDQKVSEYRQNNGFLKERERYPKILFLYVGQLLERKGIKQVLAALKELKNFDVGLMIVGSGPEEKKFKQFCEENNLKNVYFEGFKQQEELPKYYALADVFILPSFQEVWGLVVNEALASGLFVLSSKYAGASYDLIKEGENGYIIDPKDINDIKAKIELTIKKFLNNPWSKEVITKSIKNFNPEQAAEQVIQAIINS